MSYGGPNAGKTGSGRTILAFDGHENDQEFNVNMQHVDTLARLGETISKTTFPKLVDEMELIDKQTGRELTNLTGAIKSAIDQPVARKVLDRNRNEDLIPALSALIMTSNPPPPLHNSALMKRLVIRYFPTTETHLKNSQESIDYDKKITSNLYKLHVIGRFRNWYIMNHQDTILDVKLNTIPKSTEDTRGNVRVCKR